MHLEQTANVSRSCELSKMKRRHAYELKAEDSAFSDAWERALDIGFDKLEEEAIRRAYEGYEKPVFQGGRLVGTIREYSDTLMCLLLKGRKRRVYGDKQEISGPNGGPIHVRTLGDFYRDVESVSNNRKTNPESGA